MMAGISCSKNKTTPKSPTPSMAQWIITKVEGPTKGVVNDSIPIIVYWPYGNGCDVLDRFEETQQGDEIDIKAFGHTNYGFCTEMAGIKTKVFNFYASSPGKYKLKFLNPDETYFIHIVTVE